MTTKELSSCLDFLDAKEKRFRKDDVILHAGEQTSKIGMVLSGSVTIESNDIWGNRTVLSHVGKNQFFAETYALLGEVLLVDVRAFLSLSFQGAFNKPILSTCPKSIIPIRVTTHIPKIIYGPIPNNGSFCPSLL